MFVMVVLVAMSIAVLNICVSNAVGALRSVLLQVTCVRSLLPNSVRTAAKVDLCESHCSTCRRLNVLLTIGWVGMHAVRLHACHSCTGVLGKIL